MRDYPHLYVATGDADQSHQLAALLQASGQLAFFCINDTTDDAHGQDPRLAQVRATLESLFPLASPFEKPGEARRLNPVHGPHNAHHARAHPARPVEKTTWPRTLQGFEAGG
jgi:hypothetical protein